MVIRFVFPTVQHNDTGIPPIERAVSPVPYVVVVVAQTDRIGIADFMVATHKESRYTVATHSFCQFTDKTGCLIMVHRVVYTVTIEDNEVIIDILDLLTQRSEGLRMLMQVIKDNGSKRVCIRCRKCKLTEGRLRRIAEHLFIRLIKQNFL